MLSGRGSEVSSTTSSETDLMVTGADREDAAARIKRKKRLMFVLPPMYV
jgi:hypothetical protein